ncbi:hypothetical protein WJX84_010032 [Apatococcus fuscideae]|uniref:N-acetyltransferase domain-containing protein n=1 Tax=Apatococcus fuscideae TaxID=2026836 RepID=A0AAW1TF83_9CHLO
MLPVPTCPLHRSRVLSHAAPARLSLRFCSSNSATLFVDPTRRSPFQLRPPADKEKMLYGGVRAATEGISPDKSTWWKKLESRDLSIPQLSKADQAWMDEGLEFVYTREGVSISELNDLFQKVGFPVRDPEKLATALEHSSVVLWIRCSKGSRWARLGQMLGFARAITDGGLSATIWDVAINPAWQRVGLGRALMERLLGGLIDSGIPAITLYADPKVVTLYEKLGFARDPKGIRGMAFQTRKSRGQMSNLSKR